MFGFRRRPWLNEDAGNIGGEAVPAIARHQIFLLVAKKHIVCPAHRRMIFSRQTEGEIDALLQGRFKLAVKTAEFGPMLQGPR